MSLVSRTEPKTDVVMLETPFFSQSGTAEVKAYVQSKYNLALLALGSYIKQHSNYSVRLINMVKENMTEDSLVENIRRNRPKIVAVPLYSYNLGLSYRMIRAIRREFPEIHISVGGPHAAIFPKETIALEGIDSMVLGDGEYPFLGICDQVLSTGELHPEKLPPGVHVKRSLESGKCLGSYVHPNLNELPMPDLTLLENHRDYKDFLSNKVMGILTTSRGCPFVCHFCWSEKSKYRSFSIEKIINTMKYYKEMGVQYIEFWDETFNPTRKRLDDFADALVEANLDLTWSIRGAVVHHVYPETLRKLKKTGLRIMQFGVESTNNRVLEMLNKKMNRDKIESAIKTCQQEGIRSVANMIIGNPGQTIEEIKEDLATIYRYRPTYVSVSIYNWAPGTTHYENALKNSVVDDFWREHAKNPTMEDPLRHPKSDIPIDEVYRIRSKFVFKFYFNPMYVFRYLQLVSFSELRRAISIGLMMFRSSIQNMSLQFKSTFQ